MKLGGGINKINSLSFGGGEKKFSNCPLEGGGDRTHFYFYSALNFKAFHLIVTLAFHTKTYLK
jgi:hypothetical protein